MKTKRLLRFLTAGICLILASGVSLDVSAQTPGGATVPVNPPRRDDPERTSFLFMAERMMVPTPSIKLNPRRDVSISSDRLVSLASTRQPARPRRDLSAEYYRRLQLAMAQTDDLPQYSTARNTEFSPRSRLRGFLASHSLPLSAHVAGLVELESLRTTGSSGLGTWTQLGPFDVGGRTRSLLIDPADPKAMYAGSVAGGVWRSTDGGLSWSSFADDLAHIAIGAMAMDPKQTSTLYAGTGEGYSNFDAVRGAGIYRYTKAGGWQILPNTNTRDFFFVQKIAVSPRDSSRIYAATGTGVFRSTDGGKTWAMMVPAASIYGCADLAIQPGNSGYTFATCGMDLSGAQNGAIWRAADVSGPQTWQIVFTQTNMARTSLAIAPSAPNVVYAAASSNRQGSVFNEGLLGIYRSDKNGDPESWTTQVSSDTSSKLNSTLFTNLLDAFWAECHPKEAVGNAFLNQGWYDNVLAVDPKNPRVVWLGGVDVFRSDDSGMNWGIASYWWLDNSPARMHSDHHTIVFHPAYDGSANQTVFIGNDGGVWQTDNARGNVGRTLDSICGTVVPMAVAWTPRNNGYAVTQFYHGAVVRDGTYYIGGSQDNGTFLGRNAGPSATGPIFKGVTADTSPSTRPTRRRFTRSTRILRSLSLPTVVRLLPTRIVAWNSLFVSSLRSRWTSKTRSASGPAEIAFSVQTMGEKPGTSPANFWTAPRI
jgi:hypothetical protein